MDTGAENKQTQVDRREFVKLAGLFALFVAGCNRAEEMPQELPVRVGEVDAGTGDVEEWVSGNSFIKEGEVGKNIWQVEIEEGGSLAQAINEVSLWNTWSGFAATLIDGERVVHFAGDQGGGKEALLATQGFADDGAFAGIDALANLDLRTVQAGSQLVFGKTKVVNGNLEKLKESGDLGVDKYLQVEHNTSSLEGGRQEWYAVTEFRQDGDNWRHTPFFQMQRKITGTEKDAWELVDKTVNGN